MEITSSYVAGFFDGEGSIGVYKNSRRRQPGFSLRTQLTQNKSRDSEALLRHLLSKYGGNLSAQRTLSGKTKYNWQLNSDKAARFLLDIRPFLIIKKTQAALAIFWQGQRPKRSRGKNGRIRLTTAPNREVDEAVSRLLRELKVRDVDEVMENAKDLVEVRHVLRQILNVKGD